MKRIILFGVAFSLLTLSSSAQAADWSDTAIDSDNVVGISTSLAIDANGKIHVSYNDATNSDLKYITNASGSLVDTTVDSINDLAFGGTSLAIDSDGYIHIAYTDDTNDNLKYATNKSGSWVATTIDSTDEVGNFPSIAIDSNGKIHISYWDVTNTSLKYATNVTGSWVATTLDTNDWSGSHTSIAIDSNNKVHISHVDVGTELRYATNKSVSWVYENVDTGDFDYRTSLSLDSSGYAHISYYDATGDNLKYATNVTGSWVATAIDTDGDVGLYSSLAIDTDGNIYISYQDNTNDDLKYATNVSGAWAITTLMSEDVTGSYTSLALDANERKHIAYMNVSDGDLKYIYTIGPSAPILTIDSESQYVGELGISLVLAASGNPLSMMISEDSDFSSATWEDYATTSDFIISSGDGTKTIYAKFRDQWYAETDAASDAIYLDTTGPTVTASLAEGTYGTLRKVSVSADDGAGSGADTIYYTLNGNTPTTSSSEYSSAISVYRDIDLKALATDVLGNEGTVSTYSYNIQKVRYVSKSALSKQILIAGENTKYYANDFEFYFTDFPSQLQNKKYYLEIRRYKKYPSHYSSVKRKTLMKYWRLKSNLNKYNKDEYSFKLVFKYTNHQYRKLKNKKADLQEGDLLLKYYNYQTAKWETVANQTVSTGNNMISVTVNSLNYKNNLFTIGI